MNRLTTPELDALWGVEGIQIPVAAVEAGEGVEGVAAIPKVSLTQQLEQLSQEIVIPAGANPQQVEEIQVRRGNLLRFGPASVPGFVATIALTDPLMAQLVVLNVNRGFYHGEVVHIRAAMATQILTYYRYARRNALPISHQKRVDLVTSYSMAELLGPYIPANHHLDQNDAREEIIETVTWALMEDPENTLANIVGEPEEWFSALIGPWETYDELMDEEELDIDQCLALLLTWACVKRPSREWLNNANLFANTVTAISKRGNITEQVRTKIEEGMNADLNLHNTAIREGACVLFFRNFGKFITGANAPALFNHLRDLIPDICQRLSLTVQQATNSGLTVYFLIQRAMTEFPTFPWPVAAFRLEDEFGAYLIAAGVVGNNGFYGFNQDLNLVKSTRFPSLGFLAKELCVKAGGDNALIGYAGLKGAIKQKPWILTAVTEYIANRNNEVIPADRVAHYEGLIADVREAIENNA